MRGSLVVAAVLLHSGLSLGDQALLAALKACNTISHQVSNSTGVYYLGSLNYLPDISHWMTSSTQDPACVVEVGSVEDTSKVIKVIGSTKTPFAIKSGGHSSNPGFSSTKGVQISMKRLNQITLSSDKSRVTVGLGNIWADVYNALDGTGRGVNGGRVSGPGTGGFSLGGGYSWTTNQHGLTADSAILYTLVMPNGTITKVTPGSDLAFALKGGLNRFGVVTDITFKTYAQGDVYGGIQVFGVKDFPALLNATNIFSNSNTDKNAQAILTINTGVTPGAILLLFYDGPRSAALKAFSMYVNLKPLLSTVKEQSFASFTGSVPSQIQGGKRGAFHTMMTTALTAGFLDAVLNETKYYGDQSSLLHDAGGYYSYDLEPFDSKYGQHAQDSAFPHDKSPLPLNLYWAWFSADHDAHFRKEMAESVNRLIKVAKAEGIFDESQPVYPNYALSSYKGEQLYGANTARLRVIQKEVDPHGVMFLSGGFTI